VNIQNVVRMKFLLKQLGRISENIIGKECYEVLHKTDAPWSLFGDKKWIRKKY
jgi:hypothetical protein